MYKKVLSLIGQILRNREGKLGLAGVFAFVIGLVCLFGGCVTWDIKPGQLKYDANAGHLTAKGSIPLRWGVTVEPPTKSGPGCARVNGPKMDVCPSATSGQVMLYPSGTSPGGCPGAPIVVTMCEAAAK
jgi:hypothetical protein